MPRLAHQDRRNRIILAGALAIGIGLLATGGDADPAFLHESGPYRCSTTGFGMTLPATWKLAALPGSHSGGAFAHGEDDAAGAVVPCIVFSHGYVHVASSLAELVDSALTGMHAEDGSFRLLASGTREVADLEATWCEFSGESFGVEVRGVEVTWLHGGHVYRLRFTSPRESFESYRASFDAVLDSVRLPNATVAAGDDDSVI